MFQLQTLYTILIRFYLKIKNVVLFFSFFQLSDGSYTMKFMKQKIMVMKQILLLILFLCLALVLNKILSLQYSIFTSSIKSALVLNSDRLFLFLWPNSLFLLHRWTGSQWCYKNFTVSRIRMWKAQEMK